MHEQKSRYDFRTRLAMIVLSGLFLLPAGVFAVSVRLEPLSLMPGESGTTNLTLDSIPSGISGYRTGLRLTTPSIAEITGVSFPSWAGVNDQTGFPGPDVTIKAAAIGDPVPEKSGMTLLATLTVKGITAGTTRLVLYDLSIDDGEEGDAVNASIENTSITVSSATTLAGSTFPYAGNTEEVTISGAEGQVTTQPSGSLTTIPPTVQVQEQTTDQEHPQLTTDQDHDSQTTDQEQPQLTEPTTTNTSAVPSDQTPAVPPTARGVPFLSLAGMLGLLVVILLLGNSKKKR
jgi:hypothetical protein